MKCIINTMMSERVFEFRIQLCFSDHTSNSLIVNGPSSFLVNLLVTPSVSFPILNPAQFAHEMHLFLPLNG
jgi:hypothetical protein